ncbi:transporter substrate-binding domain-containing protein [Endozoicomonadaceae bacterium StTr2]
MTATIITRVNFLLVGWWLLMATMVNAADHSKPGTSLIDRVIATGKIKVAVALYTPGVMKDGAGQLSGFDVDVARQLASELKAEPVFVELPWQDLPNAISAGKADMAISSMTVTVERNLKGLFSIPYNRTKLVLLARQSKALDKKTQIQDFDSSAVKVVSLQGTVEARLAKERLPDAVHHQVPSQKAQLEALLSGSADITLVEVSRAQQLWRQYEDELFMPTDEPFFRGQEAIMLPRGDIDGLNLVNNWILQRLADGWLQQRHDYWYISSDLSE